MKKILGLDLGDQWTGTAISDALGFAARPLKTVPSQELISFLHDYLDEGIATVVVGNPITLKGKESLQTHKVYQEVEKLKNLFPRIQWILWDERLSSSFAQRHKKSITKENRLQSHSIAAAYILQSYLEYLKFQQSF